MKVSVDNVAQLLASAPPRDVTRDLQRELLRQKGGWVVAIFGMIFGSFGMLFVALFVPWNFLSELRLELSAKLSTGKVLFINETRMSVNEQRVWEYRFEYSGEGGVHKQSICYATGRPWAIGETVAVRYLPGENSLARIEGGRLSQAGWFGGTTVIFPLVGYGMVAWFFAARRKDALVLREGQAIEVKVISVDETSTTVNYKSVYRIVIEAPALPGGRMTVKRVNDADISLALRRAREKQTLFALYHPRFPKHILFPEALVGA